MAMLCVCIAALDFSPVEELIFLMCVGFIKTLVLIGSTKKKRKNDTHFTFESHLSIRAASSLPDTVSADYDSAFSQPRISSAY